MFRHERNQGKGAAVRTAIAHAEGAGRHLDADLEYSAEDLGRLLEPLPGGRRRGGFRRARVRLALPVQLLHRLGNRAVTLVANLIYNSYLADIMTCHKAMATDVWRALDLRARGFDPEGEITASVLASGRSDLRGADHLPRARPRGGQEARRASTRFG